MSPFSNWIIFGTLLTVVPFASFAQASTGCEGAYRAEIVRIAGEIQAGKAQTEFGAESGAASYAVTDAVAKSLVAGNPFLGILGGVPIVGLASLVKHKKDEKKWMASLHLIRDAERTTGGREKGQPVYDLAMKLAKQLGLKDREKVDANAVANTIQALNQSGSLCRVVSEGGDKRENALFGSRDTNPDADLERAISPDKIGLKSVGDIGKMTLTEMNIQ